MTRTGLRELRQQASELVRRAEAGEVITVTVSGREVAELGPVRKSRWRRSTDIAEVFGGAADKEWVRDQDAIDSAVVDPFTR